MASLLRLSAALLAALLLVPAAASAAQDQQRLDRTVRYLQDVQHKDGGFGERGSDPGFSAWAALALASAGINPRDQCKKPDGTDVYTYLTRHTGGLTQSTDYARVILVARAAGHLAAALRPDRPGRPAAQAPARGRRLRVSRPTLPGSQINGTAYAVLALAGKRPATYRPRPGLAADQAGRRRIVGGHRPHRFGDRGAERRRPPRHAGPGAALAYLRARQNADGGFGQGESGEASNTASTSWVVRGLVRGADSSPPSLRGRGDRARRRWITLPRCSRPTAAFATRPPTGATPSGSPRSPSPALAGASLPIAAVRSQEQPKTELARRFADPHPWR